MNRRTRQAMLAKWRERRAQNPEQPLDEFMVLDALICGYVERSRDRIRKSDGRVRVEFQLPAEVNDWLEREAHRQGITVMELVERLSQAGRAWNATEDL